MRENLQQIVYLVRHDPAAIVGFLVIGCGGVLSFHVQLKMVRAGYKSSASVLRNPWATLGEYLKVHPKHQWSPWPAYLVGPCLILGVGVLVFGLFRL